MASPTSPHSQPWLPGESEWPAPPHTSLAEAILPGPLMDGGVPSPFPPQRSGSPEAGGGRSCPAPLRAESPQLGQGSPQWSALWGTRQEREMQAGPQVPQWAQV